MRRYPLSAAEQRVLGCLIEKRYSTPDQYPLTLNSLRLACNQATNRDPVVSYDEETVHAAAQRLCQYGLARLATGHTSRAIKYRHLAEEALGLERHHLALLAVLLLRGPQTPGELKARAERMAALGSLEEVEAVLGQLIDHGYAQRLPRRPGQKEDRFAHTLGEQAPAPEHAPSDDSPAPAPARHAPVPPQRAPGLSERCTAPSDGAIGHGSLEARVAALEAELLALRGTLEAEVAALRGALEAELGALRGRSEDRDL